MIDVASNEILVIGDYTYLFTTFIKFELDPYSSGNIDPYSWFSKIMVNFIIITNSIWDTVFKSME